MNRMNKTIHLGLLLCLLGTGGKGLGSENKKKPNYFFKWKMWLSTPNLNGGDGFFVSGVSEIHFLNGLVNYHRDYFDMGEMVYEKVPVLGWLTKKIKGRLKHQ